MHRNRSSPATQLLVIGCSRSGTTLLCQTLGQHPHIFISPETKYFQWVWSQRHLLKLLPRTRRIQIIKESLLRAEYPRENPILAHALGVFDDFRDDHLKSFAKFLTALSDKPIIGEKTPWHTPLAKHVAQGHTRFLAITREAPAVVASSLQRKILRRTSTIEQCAARWLFMNRRILDLKKHFSPERFQMVKFENLILHPAETLDAVCQWLNVDFEEQLLSPEFQDSSYDGVRNQTGFEPSVLSHWKSALSHSQIERIHGLCNPLYPPLGYASEVGFAPFPSQLVCFFEQWLYKLATLSMVAGVYPFGALSKRASP